VHSFEIGGFDFIDVDQLSLRPESDFKKLVIYRVNAKVDLFPWIRVYLELYVIYRDSSVRIYSSIHSETEDIFNRLEGGPNLEFSKKRLFFL